jgi:hypothetical protein
MLEAKEIVEAVIRHAVSDSQLDSVVNLYILV